MATLKDLLRAETLKVGSNGAMPSDQNIMIVEKTNFASGSDDGLDYTAPCDGVLSAFLQSDTNENSFAGVEILNGSNRHAARTYDGSVHMNVRKGDTVRAAYWDVKSYVYQWRVMFTKTIGGGAKSTVAQLIWRVVPCLRNCLTRAWRRIEDPTGASLRGPSLRQTSRSRPVLSTSTIPPTYTCRQATACSSSSANPQTDTPTTTLRFVEPIWIACGLKSATCLGQWVRYLVERVSTSVGMLGLTDLLSRSRHTSAFTHTSGSSLSVGGAYA